MFKEFELQCQASADVGLPRNLLRYSGSGVAPFRHLKVKTASVEQIEFNGNPVQFIQQRIIRSNLLDVVII